jgi:hypothetical protein
MNSDIWLPRLIVSAVAAISLTALIGYIVLPTEPPSLLTLATGALGSLLGYLVPSPLNRPVAAQREATPTKP